MKYLVFISDYHVKPIDYLCENQDPSTPNFMYYIKTVDRIVLFVLGLVFVKTDIMTLLKVFLSAAFHQRSAHTAGHHAHQHGEGRQKPFVAGNAMGVGKLAVITVVTLLIGLL